MENLTRIVLVLVCLAHNLIFAQEDLQLTSKDSTIQSSWIVGLGYNIVDDSGDVFDKLFAVNSEWNTVAFPNRISVGRYFKSGLGVEAIGSYNKYRVGKIIDSRVNAVASDYLAFDARLSYDLNKLIGETAWLDPYIGIGAGYTDANNTPRGTYNAVIGFRTWISDRFGLDFSSSGKWRTADIGTNHIQHAAGIVYQFGIKKGLSKKGKKKLALIEILEKEKQRVNDSIATVDRARKEATLAERLRKEKEEARLVAVEKAKIDAENQRKRNIENEIKELGYVYFDLNSSYLSKEYKVVLDKLVLLLQNNPTVELRISSHTDSRGADTYNKWLSERRVRRTIDYIIDKNIEASRITGEALGEEQLANDCVDGVYCSESKHRINRRSEFKILSM